MTRKLSSPGDRGRNPSAPERGRGADAAPATGLDSGRWRVPGERWVLRLYVAGLTARSARAIERVRGICDDQLRGRCELEVIDIYQLPALAKGDQIVATPTLIRILPAPLRRYIGDLSKEKIVFGLDVKERRA